MLKRALILIAISYAAFRNPHSASAQMPLGTEFTYQGQLNAPNMPAVGNADFQFSLFDADHGGSQIGSTVARDDVGLVDGLFTTSLDFGAGAFNGDARWIEVAVRSPAGAGAFITLAPRQALAATPYAIQTRGITVDPAGNVGVGTQTPGKKLTVAGDMELGTSSSDYRHLRIGGGNCDGFIYGSYAAFGDGIHIGYNYYAKAEGNDHRTPGFNGSRISMADGEIRLATNFCGYAPCSGADVLVVTSRQSYGRVGIHTSTPQATLDVDGSFRTGSPSSPWQKVL